jgi:hypothetical protein
VPSRAVTTGAVQLASAAAIVRRFFADVVVLLGGRGGDRANLLYVTKLLTVVDPRCK